MNDKRGQLEEILPLLKEEKFSALKKQGQSLVDQMKKWDEDMVQRKSKAYDDVENFPNKFTANYLFVVNHLESDIPRVSKPSLDRLKELNAEWAPLQSKAREILDKEIPSLNKQLWDAGFGAVWKK